MTTEGRPGRRLRLLRGGHSPGVQELDALLRGVDELRLTLATDLSLVAAAVESDAPELAVEILDSDLAALHRFEDRALDQLAVLADPPRRRSRLASHTAPAVAAAALVAVLAGLVPQAATTGTPTDVTASTVAASDSLARLQDLVARGDEQQARLASATLHQQLADVVSHAQSDPMAAQQALLILSYEQNAIVANGESEALADVLVRSRQLAQAIRAALPKSVRAVVPLVLSDGSTASPKPKPKPSASAKPTSSAKPSPKSTASPSPTTSSSPKKDEGIVPPAPNLAP